MSRPLTYLLPSLAMMAVALVVVSGWALLSRVPAVAPATDGPLRDAETSPGPAGRVDDEPIAPRRTLLAIEEPPVVAEPAPTPARRRAGVKGVVRRDGRPVRDFDLTFSTSSDGGRSLREVDWDFSDEDGRYEVSLPAGSYTVRDENDRPLAVVVVNPPLADLVVDLDVPPDR